MAWIRPGMRRCTGIGVFERMNPMRFVELCGHQSCTNYLRQFCDQYTLHHSFLIPGTHPETLGSIRVELKALWGCVAKLSSCEVHGKCSELMRVVRISGVEQLRWASEREMRRCGEGWLMSGGASPFNVWLNTTKGDKDINSCLANLRIVLRTNPKWNEIYLDLGLFRANIRINPMREDDLFHLSMQQWTDSTENVNVWILSKIWAVHGSVIEWIGSICLREVKNIKNPESKSVTHKSQVKLIPVLSWPTEIKKDITSHHTDGDNRVACPPLSFCPANNQSKPSPQWHVSWWSKTRSVLAIRFGFTPSQHTTSPPKI